MTNEPRSSLLTVLSPKLLVPLVVVGALIGSIVLYRDLRGSTEALDPNSRAAEFKEWQTQLEAKIAAVRSDYEATTKQLTERLDRLERATASQCKKAYVTLRSKARRDRVYINGDLVGSTRPSAYEVCAGTVDIRVEADGFAEYRQKLELAPGKETNVVVPLRRIK